MRSTVYFADLRATTKESFVDKIGRLADTAGFPTPEISFPHRLQRIRHRFVLSCEDTLPPSRLAWIRFRLSASKGNSYSGRHLATTVT